MSSNTAVQEKLRDTLPIADRGTRPVAVVELHAVTYVYPRFTLGPQSWRLTDGSRCALVGANGAGKTTLLSILAGQLSPTSGTAQVAGSDVARDAIAVRESVAFVTERLLCLPWLTVGEHFRLQAKFFSGWNMETALRSADAFSLDLSAKLHTLSRGTSLKVALSAALAQGANLLLLDEPTAGLDPVARLEFVRLLNAELASRPSLSAVFATHILEDIDDLAATDLIVLKAGAAEHIDPATRNHGENVSALARRRLIETIS